MFDLSTSQLVAYFYLALFTIWATVSDLKSQRIPNWLTLCGLVAGIAWQVGFHGVAGLGHAAAGFAIGFGTFFVLWMTGGSGGGDVKLMEAIGVWLGFKPTLYVLLISTILVLVLSVGRRLLAQTREPSEEKIRGIELALPVTIAVWGIVLLDIATPARNLLSL
ncbi:MAG: A24 family peptidase [Planctomycetaceae bacterium]|jgi:prepilin peptidase CpaA|nr:A24 family peptidase [Planctomycetaceae bacterium]